jgi:hypothetical protein
VLNKAQQRNFTFNFTPLVYFSLLPQDFLSVGSCTLAYQLKYSYKIKSEAITLEKYAANGRQTVVDYQYSETNVKHFKNGTWYIAAPALELRSNAGAANWHNTHAIYQVPFV